MTSNRNLKRQVRSRAAKTGESYTAALSHVRPQLAPEPAGRRVLRLAVAQTDPPSDPRDAATLRQTGETIRGLMARAGEAGARLLHFPEGATCAPHKRVMSSMGPEEVGPADWGRFDWGVLAEELAATSAAARELGLWVVLGSVQG